MSAVKGVRILPGLALALGLLGAAPPEAFATSITGALKQGWECVKASAKGVVAINKGLLEKGEAVAKMSVSAGACVAEAGADEYGFAAVTGVIGAIKVASPGSVPNGKCKPSIEGALAKPFGEAVAAVVPVASVKSQIRQTLESDDAAEQLWSELAALPPPMSIWIGHVDCACEMIDDGVTLADFSTVTGAINAAGKQCSSFLDDLHLGFLNDLRPDRVVDWAVAEYTPISGQVDQWFGQEKNAPDETVYQGFFGAYRAQFAQDLAQGGVMDTATVGMPGGWADEGPSCYQTGCQITVGGLNKKCVEYYDSHTLSESHAHTLCNQFQDRVVGEASAQAKELTAIAAIRKLQTDIAVQVHKDFDWRLAAAVGESLSMVTEPSTFNEIVGGAVQDTNSPLPWSYTGTGLAAAARSALPNLGNDPQAAMDVAYAGAKPAFQKAVIAHWKANAVYVRRQFLPKWMPATTFTTDAYGCPTAPAFTEPCQAQVEKQFDLWCVQSLAEDYAQARDVAHAAISAAIVRTKCVDNLLKPIVARATALSSPPDAVKTATVAGCPATMERTARSSCGKGYRTAWDNCALQAFAKGQDVPVAQTCFEKLALGMKLAGSTKTTRTTLPMPTETIPTPKLIPMPKKPKVQLLNQ